MEWAAHVVEYVNFVWKATHTPAGAKTAKPALSKDIPYLGPRFVPPSYLKPLNIIHPFYFPELLQCPRCDLTDKNVSWAGWTGTGYREVHGIFEEETALGFQLRCDACKKLPKRATSGSAAVPKKADSSGPSHHCFATTSYEFWERRHHWEVPSDIPHFFKRCAVTRNLFDLLTEMRPSTTSAGFAEHIKQLHLLEYHRRRSAYLRCFERRQLQPSMKKMPALARFSKANVTSDSATTAGYDAHSITDDLVTDVYLAFVDKTRKEESDNYTRTLAGICLSTDNTYEVAGKATVVTEKTTRMKLMKGGIMSIINELNEIIAWRFCQTQSNAELYEQLLGLKNRFELLNVADPEMAVADNCCHIRNAILQVFPDIAVLLDVWHFMMRYLIVVINGTKNPYRAAVARDITDAILKSTAKDGNLAVYWSKEEQERRLQEAFDKWAETGGVWTAAAADAHATQLKHVRKGCLARPRQDIASDGSRIEGTHKAWNSLQRAQSSGIEVLLGLCCDFVLRRNVRIGSALKESRPFLESTFGSHQVGLVNATNKLWNKVLQRCGEKAPAGFLPLPELPIVNSGETFGLVTSKKAFEHWNLFSLKSDHIDDDDDDDANNTSKPMVDLSSQNKADSVKILRELGIDPSGLQIPLPHIKDTIASAQAARLTGSPVTSSSRNCADNIIDVDADSTEDCEAGPSQREGQLPATACDADVEALTPASAGHLAIVRGAAALTIGTTPRPDPDRRAGPSDMVPVPVQASCPPRLLTAPDHHGASASGGPLRDVPKSDDQASRKRKAAKETPSLEGSEGQARASASTSSKRIRVAGTTPKDGIHRGRGKQPQTIQATAGRSKNDLLAFFPVQRGGTAADTQVRSDVNVGCPLPLPIDSLHLTRSARLFSILTGIVPTSLRIEQGREFFLFMELRKTHQWVSYQMTPRKWVAATEEYNEKLREKNIETDPSGTTIAKKPRALLDKLALVEKEILARLTKNNYTSKASGTQDFWKEHCEAVVLLYKDISNSRKNHACTRCKTIMWPYPEGSSGNHPREYCSDGVARTGKDKEPLPRWPQPAGVFSNGNRFHAAPFLATVREMYERFVLNQHGGVGERLMEYLAFSEMLTERTSRLPDGKFVFKLYKTMPMVPTSSLSHLVINIDDAEYLRIDELGEEEATGGNA